jgi:hypothetical protein
MKTVQDITDKLGAGLSYQVSRKIKPQVWFHVEVKYRVWFHVEIVIRNRVCRQVCDQVKDVLREN